MTIKIDPEFKSLIPAISNEELKALEESLLNEGCRDPFFKPLAPKEASNDPKHNSL